jgi:hypothetical protein
MTGWFTLFNPAVLLLLHAEEKHMINKTLKNRAHFFIASPYMKKQCESIKNQPSTA